MKIHYGYLIIGSIVLFLLDFFILANETIFHGQELEVISQVVALVCALAFVVGIVWAVIKFIFQKTRSHPVVIAAVQPVMTPEKSRLVLTTLEIVFNRIFAFLLVLSAVPLLLNILSLPTIVIFIVFALFLWFVKKYHPVVNFFFLIIALGIYFVPIPPISWGFFRALKEYRLNNFDLVFPLLFLPSLLIFTSFSVRNVIGNIFAYLKTSPTSRTVYFLITLLIVPAILLAYPLLDSFKLRDRTMNVNTAVGGDLPLIYTQQSLTFLDRYIKAGDFTSKFDSSSQKYIYHLRLSQPLNKSIQFTGVETDGVKINFITDSWVECLNCQKSADNPYELVFPAGKNIDFVITSSQMIKVIKFIEPGDKAAEFVFWE